MYGDLQALTSALTQLAQPVSILLLVGGIVTGLVIGILPGLGPPIAIALALPFTFYLDTVPSLILLLGIYSQRSMEVLFLLLQSVYPAQVLPLPQCRMVTRCLRPVRAVKP